MIFYQYNSQLTVGKIHNYVVSMNKISLEDFDSKIRNWIIKTNFALIKFATE